MQACYTIEEDDADNIGFSVSWDAELSTSLVFMEDSELKPVIVVLFIIDIDLISVSLVAFVLPRALKL